MKNNARIQEFDEIKNAQIGNCFMRVTLDTRHVDRFPTAPISISFYFAGTKERYYHPLGIKATRQQYIAITKATGRGRNIVEAANQQKPYDIKKQLINLFDHYYTRIAKLASVTVLTASSVRTALTGVGNDSSFLASWQQVAETKQYNTKASYLQARSSFINFCGRKSGFNVSAADIEKWKHGMTDAGLAQTTIGIYLRACRVVWNHCIAQGLMAPASYPFKKTHQSNPVAIPLGSTRKERHLSVAQMKALYDFFDTQSFPTEWHSEEINNIKLSLGLFLFQYLANGINLADAARLRYNDFYFSSGRQGFQFIRIKTKNRHPEEVVVPIIPPLQIVLDRIAAPPQKDALVFPQILADANTEEEEHKLIAQENQNIRKRIAKVANYLGWSVTPTSTWCRHSFATNLAHAGVPDRYISLAMGHSFGAGARVTDNYIDRYPLEKQIEYNAKLLTNEPQLEMIKQQLNQLSEAEKEQLRVLLQ